MRRLLDSHETPSPRWRTARSDGGHLIHTFRTAGVLLALVAALAAAACSDATSPSESLVGAWDLVGFTDGGVAATTTGTWVFRATGTFSARGTVTFPDEPTDSIAVDGIYVQRDNMVTLTVAPETADWLVTRSGSDVTLTQDEPPPANTIVLRRR